MADRSPPLRMRAKVLGGRFLGPEVETHQLLVRLDEVIAQAPLRREFIELRMAYNATQDGSR